MEDLVATWEVPLSDGLHKIDFEHGTTTGKRVIYIDGKAGFIIHDAYNLNITNKQYALFEVTTLNMMGGLLGIAAQRLDVQAGGIRGVSRRQSQLHDQSRPRGWICVRLLTGGQWQKLPQVHGGAVQDHEDLVVALRRRVVSRRAGKRHPRRVGQRTAARRRGCIRGRGQ